MGLVGLVVVALGAALLFVAIAFAVTGARDGNAYGLIAAAPFLTWLSWRTMVLGVRLAMASWLTALLLALVVHDMEAPDGRSDTGVLRGFWSGVHTWLLGLWAAVVLASGVAAVVWAVQALGQPWSKWDTWMVVTTLVSGVLSLPVAWWLGWRVRRRIRRKREQRERAEWERSHWG